MSDKKYQSRLQALTAWALLVSGRGFVAPVAADLQAIARAGNTNTDLAQVDVVDAWRDAINAVLLQVKFNIADPHLQLGSEFDEPATSAGRRPASPVPLEVPFVPNPPVVQPQSPESEALTDTSPGEAAYQELKKWRDENVSSGGIFSSTIKDSQLRTVASFHTGGHGDFRKTLTPALMKYASRMEEVLAQLDARQPQPDPVQAPADAAAPSPASSPWASVSDNPATTSAWFVAPPAGTSALAEPAAPAAPPAEPPAPVSLPAVPVVAEEAVPDPSAPPVDYNPLSFAVWDYTIGTHEPIRLTSSTDQQGTRTIIWAEAPGDGVRIYRLISGDGVHPYGPDTADFVAATHGVHVTDERPFTHSVRYYEVWLNEGPTAATALAAQPILYARDAYVGGVTEIDIREDEGRAIGQWAVLPGTHRVQIFRIPRDRASMPGAELAYRILENSDNLNGFVDTGAERGKAYIYKVYAEGQIDAMTILSAPAAIPFHFSAVLSPVRDLSIQAQEPNNSDTVHFDLTWTAPPGGQVTIYRTQEAPPAGIDLTALTVDSFNTRGALPADARLAHPVENYTGQCTMRGIALPAGWTRAYFTPVTTLGDAVHVGTPVVKSLTLGIKNPRILERVNSQILTFEWPQGAGSVMVYQSPPGQPAELALSGQPVEVTESTYRQRGGLHFESTLPANGCDLHLVPVTFEAGRRVSGSPTSINYPWILRMSYQVTPKKTLLGKAAGVSVVVTASERLDAPPPFVLVFNPDRFPLSINDGTALNMILDLDGAPGPSRVFAPQVGTPTEPGIPWRTTIEDWATDVGTAGGCLRLFANLPPEALRSVALMDPAVDTLRVKESSNVVRGLFGVK